MTSSPRLKILIVGPAWLGDMVMAQSLFRLLHSENPGVEIDVLAAPALRAVLERMPEVHRLIDLPFAHGELALLRRWQLGSSLRSAGYDRAIVLPNSWKSALIPFAARIPQRTAWRGEYRYGLLNDLRHLDPARYPLMVERFMALGLAKDAPLPSTYPFPKLETNSENRIKTLQKFQLDLAKPIIAVCPGAAFGPAKRWPIEYFGELAQALLAEGKQVWLFGGPAEMTLTAEIQTATQHACQDFAGRSSLSETIDLLSYASQVITNDSGLMHIAAALERPLTALYGASSPRFTPPLSTSADILKLDLACQPCFQRTCPLKHFRCMRDLTPSLVLEHLKKNHARSHH